MRVLTRVVAWVMLAPLWIPGALAVLLLALPRLLVKVLIAAFGFVITGIWEWPDSSMYRSGARDLC